MLLGELLTPWIAVRGGGVRLTVAGRIGRSEHNESRGKVAGS
jgi:hypothetical protein